MLRLPISQADPTRQSDTPSSSLETVSPEAKWQPPSCEPSASHPIPVPPRTLNPLFAAADRKASSSALQRPTTALGVVTLTAPTPSARSLLSPEEFSCVGRTSEMGKKTRLVRRAEQERCHLGSCEASIWAVERVGWRVASGSDTSSSELVYVNLECRPDGV